MLLVACWAAAKAVPLLRKPAAAAARAGMSGAEAAGRAVLHVAGCGATALGAVASGGSTALGAAGHLQPLAVALTQRTVMAALSSKLCAMAGLRATALRLVLKVARVATWGVAAKSATRTSDLAQLLVEMSIRGGGSREAVLTDMVESGLGGLVLMPLFVKRVQLPFTGRKAYVARNWVCFLPRVVLPGPLLRWAEAAIIRSHLLVHDYSRTLTFGALAAVPGLEKVLRPHLVPTVRRTAVAYAVLSFPKERALKRRHMRAFPVADHLPRLQAIHAELMQACAGPAAEAGLKPPRGRIHLLATRMPNACALPSGDVYVFTGLLEVLQGELLEEALTYVLAHELGHVTALHHRQRFTNHVVQTYAIELGIGGVGLAAAIWHGAGLRRVEDAEKGWRWELYWRSRPTVRQASERAKASKAVIHCVRMAQVVLHAVAHIAFMHNSRGHEREADMLSLRIAAEAGKPVDGTLRGAQAALTKFEQLDSGHIWKPTWLLTHPPPAERRANLEAEAAKMRTGAR